MRSKHVRLAVQLGVLAFMSWVGSRHQVLGGGPGGVPTVDALCPFGGLESLHIFLTSGGWLRRVAPSALVLFVGVVLVTLVVGRVFCGWICPLGTIGELSASAGRKVGLRRRDLPAVIDRPARYLKYLTLGIIIFLTWKTGTLVWRELDPWAAWMHLSAGFEGIAESPWGFSVLFGAVIFASFLGIERFWCRYLCPLGGVLAIIQKLSLVKIRRNEARCVNCHACGRACPVGLDPESVPVVTSAECLACGQCAERCAVPDTLRFGTARSGHSVVFVGLLGVALFLGVWGGARATGLWATYASPKTTQSAPADSIFGWMTIPQAAKAVKLPEDVFISAAGLPESVSRDVSIKKLPGVNDEKVRESVGDYLKRTGAQSPKP